MDSSRQSLLQSKAKTPSGSQTPAWRRYVNWYTLLVCVLLGGNVYFATYALKGSGPLPSIGEGDAGLDFAEIGRNSAAHHASHPHSRKVGPRNGGVDMHSESAQRILNPTHDREDGEVKPAVTWAPSDGGKLEALNAGAVAPPKSRPAARQRGAPFATEGRVAGEGRARAYLDGDGGDLESKDPFQDEGPPKVYKPLKCPEDAVAWAENQPGTDYKGDSHTEKGKFPLGNDPLWFLHIPRTGGRCFHSCFMKSNFHVKGRCLPSYDKFHPATLYQNCTELGSHDDYSVWDALRSIGRTPTVITLTRDPVDRFLSAYEFGLSNAARIGGGPRSTGSSKDPFAGPKPFAVDDEVLLEQPELLEKAIGRKVSTRMVWPWSHILPVLHQKLFPGGNRSVVLLKPNDPVVATLDPYDNDYFPSLTQALKLDVYADHIVNGITMQYVGITNFSHMPDGPAHWSPHDLRRCAQADKVAGRAIVDLAKRRLDAMPFVGLTKRHHESVEMAAAILGFNLSAPAFKDVERKVPPEVEAKRKAKEDAERAANGGVLKHPQPAPESVGATYVKCATRSGTGSAKKNKVGPVKFSHDLRKEIPDSVLAAIREANWMDTEIFQHAEAIFDREYAKHSPTMQRLPSFEAAQEGVEHAGLASDTIT